MAPIDSTLGAFAWLTREIGSLGDKESAVRHEDKQSRLEKRKVPNPRELSEESRDAAHCSTDEERQAKDADEVTQCLKECHQLKSARSRRNVTLAVILDGTVKRKKF